MNFGQMQQRVYSVLRDSEKAFIIPEEVEDLLNEAYFDLVARTGILQTTVTGTTSATGTISLPADFVRVAHNDGFYVATDEDDVFDHPQPARDDIFLSYESGDSTPHKTLYRIFDGTIETWPQVESKAYTLEYVYLPTALADPGDTPEIPVELHTKLVHYARAHSKMKEGEFNEAQFYLGLYYEGLPPTIPDAEREQPGPIDFVPVPSYWSKR